MLVASWFVSLELLKERSPDEVEEFCGFELS